MNWISEMPLAQPVAWSVLVLMTVGVAGLAIASIRVKGIGLGIVGVLFAGIVAGHLGLRIDQAVLEFVREFGLVLFVFTVGLQLGPGFFASFRRQGITLNLMAMAIILLGAVLTVGTALFAGVDTPAALGLFSGATTNTPSLGAAQQMLKSLNDDPADRAVLSATAYAVTYPGGVFGIIGVLVFLRIVFRIDPEQEGEQFRLEQKGDVEPLARVNLVVDNPRLASVTLADALGNDAGVIVSRIQRAGTAIVETATERTVLHRDDVILAVGTRRALERFSTLVGPESATDLAHAPGRVVSERMVVTNKQILGTSIEGLHLGERYEATITRVTRGDLEITPAPELRLQFGDIVQVVADEGNVGKVVAVLGNRFSALNETNFLPIFVGIVLGVLAGTLPIEIPGLPLPLRMGIAGGPLVLAIVLSRIGRIGPLIWYMPLNANLALRELGISLFLSCVGLKAGERFFATAFTALGLQWVLCGLAITVVPLLVVGVTARVFFRQNFTVISGLLAGSMTDPPALAFANAICRSDAPSVAYATVYPLTMLSRVLVVQILAIFFLR
jgi:putative transport protein